MCGRFTLTINPAETQETLSKFSFPQKFAPRYNIAPTQPILAIPNDDQNTADFFVWGLIPMWAKDSSIGNRLINARGKHLKRNQRFGAVSNTNVVSSLLMASMNGKLKGRKRRRCLSR